MSKAVARHPFQNEVEGILSDTLQESFQYTALDQCKPPEFVAGFPFKILEEKSYIDMDTFEPDGGQYDKITDYVFEINGRIFKTSTTYNSWDSTEMSPWVECHQVEKTVTVWEPIDAK